MNSPHAIDECPISVLIASHSTCAHEQVVPTYAELAGYVRVYDTDGNGVLSTIEFRRTLDHAMKFTSMGGGKVGLVLWWEMVKKLSLIHI